MHRPHGIDVDRVLAWCCVLIAHVLALWWLTRPHAATQPGVESDGLDVVWIEPARPVAPMPPADVPLQPTPSATASVQDEVDRRLEAPSTPAPTAEAVIDPAPALSAVFIEQGHEWARQQHSADGFARNPLTHRTVPRAEPRRDRFAMREPVSPASVVASIGKLLNGPDYTTDPCPRIRDNINNLATGGPSELLDEELRRDRQLCR